MFLSKSLEDEKPSPDSVLLLSTSYDGNSLPRSVVNQTCSKQMSSTNNQIPLIQFHPIIDKTYVYKPKFYLY